MTRSILFLRFVNITVQHTSCEPHHFHASNCTAVYTKSERIQHLVVWLTSILPFLPFQPQISCCLFPSVMPYRPQFSFHFIPALLCSGVAMGCAGYAQHKDPWAWGPIRGGSIWTFFNWLQLLIYLLIYHWHARQGTHHLRTLPKSLQFVLDSKINIWCIGNFHACFLSSIVSVA